MPKYEYAGVMPGSTTIGDMIQNTQAQMKPSRLARSPMGMRKRPMQPDAVRTTVDFRSTPMMKTRVR
jgi:hypothetical protein